MIAARPFLMIRHGQSTANLQEICSGSIDVALTDLGREQAREAGKIIAALPRDQQPARIFHSHLSRARDTAHLINESLGGLAMTEIPDIAEQFFGEWESQPWEHSRPQIYAGIDPAGGETHSAFQERVKRAVNHIFSLTQELPLIVCHGGVFRAFAGLYGETMNGVRNCTPYRFIPRRHAYPWDVSAV